MIKYYENDEFAKLYIPIESTNFGINKLSFHVENFEKYFNLSKPRFSFQYVL